MAYALDHPSSGFEAGLRSLFKRCVTCPDTAPTCPVCQDGEQCVQMSGNCDVCASRVCVSNAQATGVDPSPPPPPSPGPNIGAIVGGVVGGVVVICIVVFLVYWFRIRGRQEEEEEFEEEYAEDETVSSKHESQGQPQGQGQGQGYSYGSPRSGQATNHRSNPSQHSVRSMASTVLTRASNVIQIAFIPGITDRGNTDSPHDSSIPPVPTVPYELRNQTNTHTQTGTPYTERNIPASPYSDNGSQVSQDHYFTARDLGRPESTWSGYTHDSRHQNQARPDSTWSGYINEGSIGPMRQSVASMAPSLARDFARESFASTIYQDTNPQMASRFKPNMVSIKGGMSPANELNVPEVPEIDYGKYGHFAKPGQVKQVDSSKEATPTDTPAELTSAEATTDEEAPKPTETSPLKKHSHSRSRSGGSKGKNKVSASESAALLQAIQDATRRASAQPTHGGLGSVNRQTQRQKDKERDPSPFADENAIGEEDEDGPTDADDEGEMKMPMY